MLNITFTNPILLKSTNTRHHVPLYRSPIHRYTACHKYLRGGWILEVNTCPIWNVSGPRVLLTKQGTTLFGMRTLYWCCCLNVSGLSVCSRCPSRCRRETGAVGRGCRAAPETCHEIQILRLTSNPLQMLDHRFCVRLWEVIAWFLLLGIQPVQISVSSGVTPWVSGRC